jgi:lysophospholipase L1-like esterase
MEAGDTADRKNPCSESMDEGVWATEGIGYLDYYSAMVNDQHGLKAKFSGDGVHPNEAGYTIMAPLVADAIAKSKLQPSKKSP